MEEIGSNLLIIKLIFFVRVCFASFIQANHLFWGENYKKMACFQHKSTKTKS